MVLASPIFTTMKIFLNIVLLFFFKTLAAQQFEGKLVYYVALGGQLNMQGEIIDLQEEYQKRETFDTLTIHYKKGNYVKTFNKGDIRKIVWLEDKKKKFTFENSTNELTVESFKPKFFSSVTSPPNGDIVNLAVLEIPCLAFGDHCKTLNVNTFFAKEQYIFSEDLPKLTFNRNIILEPNSQRYSEEVAKVLDHAIPIYCQVQFGMLSIEARLISIEEQKISPQYFLIPKTKKRKKGKRSRAEN